MLKGLFSKVKEKIRSYREERRRRQEEYRARVKEGMSKLEKYDLPSAVKHELATKYASGFLSGSELHSYARSLERKRKKIKRKKIIGELSGKLDIDISASPSTGKTSFLSKLADMGERLGAFTEGFTIDLGAINLGITDEPAYKPARSKRRSSRRRSGRRKSKSRRRK